MVDYSKWKKIEISDDEDETHPNIDTASLFRWRHKARLERQEERRTKSAEFAEKRAELAAKLAAAEQEDDRKVLERELAELDSKEEDLKKRQKRQPWNVDTIGQESWSGTVLNKSCIGNCNSKSATEVSDYSDEAAISGYEKHVREHEDEMKQFSFHSNFEDCRRYLLAHPNLVHQFTLDYLSLWCMQLELDDKKALLEHVARQAVIIQMILDLAKTVGGGMDPRSCLPVFFERSAHSKEKFDHVFNDELADFHERVKKAAQFRLEQAIAEQEANPDQLIGPGGLNAQEVFQSLPEELQKCFENRSREQIQRVLSSMNPKDAEYHLQRCIDAGLWNVNAKDDDDEQMLAAMSRLSETDQERLGSSENSENSEEL